MTIIIRFRDEGEAELWAWWFLAMGFQWCCAGGYMNAFFKDDADTEATVP